MDDNSFKNSKDVLGIFYTDVAGHWQVSGNVTWFTLDQATYVPTIVGQTAGANTGMNESNGNLLAAGLRTAATEPPRPGSRRLDVKARAQHRRLGHGRPRRDATGLSCLPRTS
ncbi:hypothetical protein LZG04_39285 [Saccharothrix sp. S26]|uniref:hypothetical protein n=1 Tax=Saccharothrix sp. S26 TaxID=2907215 RepID=UPI001F31E363|nr:hypothetical protein [Saccharothrix sp. S26]MCE7000819.1 hypothetical protein [Saccharothrix sp. S26]